MGTVIVLNISKSLQTTSAAAERQFLIEGLKLYLEMIRDTEWGFQVIVPKGKDSV
jgi:hypothetical protein